MKKFIIKTLGCKTNQTESALMAEILVNNNFIETEKISEADYYILNSCAVTQIAQTKNLSYLKRAKRENPHIITVLTGCMAQLEKENLKKSNVSDFIIGNYEKSDIAKILINGDKYCVSDIFSHKNFSEFKLHKTKRTRALVKIQDGCNNRCTYCTIPFARGQNRSDTIENIIEQINFFASEGYYETVLTGIHIGQWGNDFDKPLSLINLIEKIEQSKITRYRLGSLNPTELTEEFIDYLAQSKKFCPHFHLSLQSCCDKTLNAMNRKYSFDDIKNLVNCINRKFEQSYIGSDIIAGFPGESEVDFNICRKNLQELALTKIHVFPYSRRKGTIADKLPNQINETEKKQRCKILQEISDNKLIGFLNSNIGSKNEVIIEKNRDKKSGMLKGVTKNYINVLINDEDKYKDTIQNIIIKNISNDYGKMIAEII